MFTGIITATTTVEQQDSRTNGLEATFKTPAGWDDLVLGESIAVNGVCLTVSALTTTQWTALLMPETLRVTSFAEGLPPQVNLERAMPLTERLSGHIVQGHVDCVGKVSNIDTDSGHVITVEFPPENATLVIYKGSITINGVSLTITDCTASSLSVALIPHTLASTTLDSLQVGDPVNLEFDVVGKYVTKFLSETNYAKR